MEDGTIPDGAAVAPRCARTIDARAVAVPPEAAQINERLDNIAFPPILLRLDCAILCDGHIFDLTEFPRPAESSQFFFAPVVT